MLFLYSRCFYKWPRDIEETSHDSRGYVFFITAGVTNGNRCGFQWFLCGKPAEFVQ